MDRTNETDDTLTDPSIATEIALGEHHIFTAEIHPTLTTYIEQLLQI